MKLSADRLDRSTAPATPGASASAGFSVDAMLGFTAAAEPPERHLPAWITAKVAVWGTAALSLLLALLALGVLWLAFSQQQIAEQAHTELYAKTLEWHSNQTLTTAELALRGLAREFELRGGQEAMGRAQQEASNQLLRQALATLPFVRSFSLLNAQGLVLASSNAGNVGQQLTLARLHGQSGSPQGGLGRLQAGRDLGDVSAVGTVGTAGAGADSSAAGRQAPGRSARHFYIPMSQPLSAATGQNQAQGYVVAALNPDYFSNVFDSQMGSTGHLAALLSLNGQLIASSHELGLPIGAMLDQHLVFKQMLPAQEDGQYRDQGLGGQASLGSFRLTRNYPWAVLVEAPKTLIWERIHGNIKAVALAFGISLGLILTLGAFAWRALSAYEQSHRELALLHRNLSAKEREQSLLIDNVQELMFRTDTEGELLFINHANLLAGKGGAPALGARFESLVDPRDQAKARNLFRSANGFLNLPIALRLAPQGGRQRVLEVSATAVKSDDGRLIGYVGFAIDVTEREDARERLQAQLDFTARLIDVCPIPIYARDRALRFVMVNQAWCEISGVDKNIALGRRLSEIKPASIAGPVEEQDARLLAQGGSERLEVRDGGRVLLTHKTVFSDARGQIAGVVGSAVDISRFIEAEQQIREGRDAAELANSIRTEFVANMSHELRTPLQSIIGFAELGQERSAEAPRLQYMFQRIFTAGHRMLELVNNLLDLSRLESPVGHLSLLKQDCRPLLAKLLHELQATATERHITLQLLMDEQPLLAAVDADRFQQALRNVLDNALRFSPSGGRIELTASLTPHCDGTEGQGLSIKIRDQGPGIPVAELENIFAPFAQSTLTKDGSGGTGLGLAICRKIMNAHGGTITAQTLAQGGAMFELRLPAC